jgi:L-ascorbate peroxidase
VHLKGTTGEHQLVEVVDFSPKTAEIGKLDRSLLLRRELQKLMSRAEAALFLRLAWHDAISYDPRSRTGGANGSLHFPEELALPEHKGLDRVVSRIACWKEGMGDVSWADLIALAGAAAVRKCGGPDISVQCGRKDALKADPVVRLPVEDAPIAVQKQYFHDRGLTTRDYVALMGGHTLGRAREVPFTDDLFTFSNSYFRRLIDPRPSPGLGFLQADSILLEDLETRALVSDYAQDEEAFFRDFASAYAKMTLLGTGIGEG